MKNMIYFSIFNPIKNVINPTIMKNILALALLCLITVFQSCNATKENKENPYKELPPMDSVLAYGNKYLADNYDRQVYQIPMRDGKNLNTVVYIPKDRKEDYPIMLLRTPYCVELAGGKYSYFQYKLGLSPNFFEEKFIFVVQDVRGRFMSEGNYENMRPQKTAYNSKNDIDESTDTFDTIDWLIKNISGNNEKVGMWGISYPGFYAIAGAINAHPALKAVSPQAPISDWFWDDFHRNGAFSLSASFGFFAVFGVEREELTSVWNDPICNTEFTDGYNFFLNELGPVKNIQEKYYNERIPFWNQFIEHPNYNKFWQNRNIIPHLKDIKPAVLTVGGLFDAEDLYGPPKIYAAIEKNSPNKTNNHLVLGPWFHGGWARSYGTELGNVYFGNNPPPSKFYQDSIEFPFFMHHLKGAENPNLSKAMVFETGTNRWQAFEKWPPENTIHKELYLHENGKLAFTKQKEFSGSGYDEFISDPENPVPFVSYTSPDVPKKYMSDDQTFASKRQDVLTYETEVLTEDITFAGNIIADLHVAITGSDADWVVKLIDVYPGDIETENEYYRGKNMGDYQQMVRSEVLRGRFRNSFEYPEPFVPHKITPLSLELIDVLHTFKKGHKIMVQVQSSWFPLVDINPQKYVANIYKANAEDYIKATHRVYHSAVHSSSLKVRILN